MIHKIYLRLPDAACLAEDQITAAHCVLIECPDVDLPELCKWLRLTADSLDGRLSASELGHLQDVVAAAVTNQGFNRGLIRAVEICQRHAQEHPETAAVAVQLAMRVTQEARK